MLRLRARAGEAHYGEQPLPGAFRECVGYLASLGPGSI